MFIRATFALGVVLALCGCASPEHRDLTRGYPEPFYPPNCWVQPPRETLWYVCEAHRKPSAMPHLHFQADADTQKWLEQIWTQEHLDQLRGQERQPKKRL